MNRTDESNLNFDVPAQPTAVPPTLHQLRRQSLRRKRNRLGVAGGLIVVVLLAITIPMRNERGSGLPNVGDAAVSQSTLSPSTPDRPNSPELRLLATVRQSLPVFEVDSTTRYADHVGWIENADVIPVDLRKLDDNQRQMLRSFLNAQPQTEPKAQLIHL